MGCCLLSSAAAFVSVDRYSDCGVCYDVFLLLHCMFLLIMSYVRLCLPLTFCYISLS